MPCWAHEFEDVPDREHQVERLQLVLEARLRIVVRVGAVAVDDARIPRRARIDRLVARFLAAAVAVENLLRPVSAVSEPRLVVIGEDAEYGDAESDRRQLLDTAAATFFASSKLIQPKCGVCTSLTTPASTAAIIDCGLTA